MLLSEVPVSSGLWTGIRKLPRLTLGSLLKWNTKQEGMEYLTIVGNHFEAGIDQLAWCDPNAIQILLYLKLRAAGITDQ
jgi:hypothetical protein